jgi:nucleoprotein TPR
MKVDCAELASELAQTTEAKKALEGKLAEAQSAQAASVEDNKVLQRQVSDLSLQLRNILRQLAIRDDPALAFETFDPVDGSLKDESDIDLVITSSLVMFNKLPELLELNKRLLRMTRSLGQELEKKERADGIADANAHLGDLNEAANVIQELTRRIQDMEAQIRDTDAEFAMISKERDMFSRMLVQGRLMGMSLDSLQSEDNATVQGVLRTIRAEFDNHRQDLQKELQTVQSRLDDKSNELREESNKLADALASLRHEQSKIRLAGIRPTSTSDRLTVFSGQNQMLVQKQAQDQAEITNHLETLALRDTEIRNLRLDIQKVRDTRRRDDAFAYQYSFSALRRHYCYPTRKGIRASSA